MTHPVAGYMFPAYDEADYDIEAIIAELAEAEAADPEDLELEPDWVLLNRYAELHAAY